MLSRCSIPRGPPCSSPTGRTGPHRCRSRRGRPTPRNTRSRCDQRWTAAANWPFLTADARSRYLHGRPVNGSFRLLRGSLLCLRHPTTISTTIGALPTQKSTSTRGIGMRSISRSLALMALGAAWLSCPAASAALPKADEAFAGTGADYLNNAPRWTRESTGRVSFETSANRRRILNFRGTYYYYCGARTGSVTARYINVNSAGQFGYRQHSQHGTRRADLGQVVHRHRRPFHR